jgi:hypothetical protein
VIELAVVVGVWMGVNAVRRALRRDHHPRIARLRLLAAGAAQSPISKSGWLGRMETEVQEISRQVQDIADAHANWARSGLTMAEVQRRMRDGR